MSPDLLGSEASAWLRLGSQVPAGCVRLVLSDVDGVITRGEGQPADLAVIARLAAWNRAALADARVPAVTLCTGRQGPYVELMAQMTEVFLPCIFEHGAGLFFPRSFLYQFDPLLGPGYAAGLASLRAALGPSLLDTGRAFVQPGKEATMTLYPLGDTPFDELFDRAAAVAPELGFNVARNVQGIELRPPGIDKGLGLRRLLDLLGLTVATTAGVGDSDPDLSFLEQVGFSAAPANATPNVCSSVGYVARSAYGEGLLEVLDVLEKRNRQV